MERDLLQSSSESRTGRSIDPQNNPDIIEAHRYTTLDGEVKYAVQIPEITADEYLSLFPSSDPSETYSRSGIRIPGAFRGLAAAAVLTGVIAVSEAQVTTAQDASNPEPGATAVAGGTVNLRSFPTTESTREGVLSANQQVNVEASYQTQNGDTWYQIDNVDGSKSWVFANLVNIQTPEVPIPNVNNLVEMTILDSFGNETPNKLGGVDVGLGSINQTFTEFVTDFNIPAETFLKENMRVLYSSAQSIVFEQKVDIVLPGDTPRKNEAGTIFALSLDASGNVADWAVWGPGQISTIANANGGTVDAPNARFRPVGEGLFALVDGTGGHAVFNSVDGLANLRNPEIPTVEEQIGDATIVAQQPFPIGVPVIEVTPDALTFENGSVFKINGEGNVRTATPEAPVEVAMATSGSPIEITNVNGVTVRLGRQLIEVDAETVTDSLPLATVYEYPKSMFGGTDVLLIGAEIKQVDVFEVNVVSNGHTFTDVAGVYEVRANVNGNYVSFRFLVRGEIAGETSAIKLDHANYDPDKLYNIGFTLPSNVEKGTATVNQILNAVPANLRDYYQYCFSTYMSGNQTMDFDQFMNIVRATPPEGTIDFTSSAALFWEISDSVLTK